MSIDPKRRGQTLKEGAAAEGEAWSRDHKRLVLKDVTGARLFRSMDYKYT